MPAKSLELQHTIRLIRELDAEIEEIETAIQTIIDELHSPITTMLRNGLRASTTMSLYPTPLKSWWPHFRPGEVRTAILSSYLIFCLFLWGLPTHYFVMPF